MTDSQASSPNGSSVPSSPEEDAPYIAKIHVHSANHLLAKDLNATSDPFVRVFFDDELVGRTQTKKGDLNPVWNAEFSVPIHTLPAPGSREPAFKFEVRNEYKFGKMTGQIQNIGKHAFLGQVVLPLSRFIGVENQSIRQEYTLEKRSHKSRVRGSLLLTIQVISKDDADNYQLPANMPDDVLESARRRSHLSVGEMAELSRALHGGHLKPGKYTLRIQFQKAFKVPMVDKHRAISFHFRVVANHIKAKSQEFEIPFGDAAPEDINLTSEPISLPINIIASVPPPFLKVYLIITTSISTHLTLGQTSISLGLIPVVEQEAEEELERIVPVDLYVEKKKLTIVPPYMKLRSHGSICMLRFSAWLVREMAMDMEEDYDASDELQSDEEDVPEIISSTPRPDQLPEPFEWDLASVEVKGSVHRANRLMFDESSPVLRAMCEEKRLTELSFTPWTEDGQREFSYLIPKSSVVQANHACEYQKYLVRCQDAYVMEIETKTPEVPYGADFVTQLRIFLLQDGPRVNVRATGRIVFSKNVFLKGVITRSAKAGMTATYKMYLKHLQSAFAPRRKKGDQATAVPGTVEEATTEEEAKSKWLSFLPRPTIIIAFQATIIVILLVVLAFLWFNNHDLAGRIAELEGLVEGRVDRSTSGATASKDEL
ncbi:hypothetical protein PTSG_05016 [Salpingoeca rosetta]|uniref:C2 domain-containing protein n=1 Tax=Salpingoeca rosetta (strain ATCC 50818 / BSB-021) TaxID=946362 RepID=F2U998_SALR5|nr:uncharacterized protein PTSG_05016 [Salpingoeca rosetta]EGD73301.1 hypothetical protein PTSG_05016 [Salpingoeca rosetta]|eukprot:XP_004994332.1 hypothetical protein PTSG_05016 [Salpingoeca rosetta]